MFDEDEPHHELIASSRTYASRLQLIERVIRYGSAESFLPMFSTSISIGVAIRGAEIQ